MTLVQSVSLFNVPRERQDFIWDTITMNQSHDIKTEWVSSRLFQLSIFRCSLLKSQLFITSQTSMTTVKAA